MKVKAYAKLNLGLFVKNKRDDGFHTLHSLLCTVDKADNIDVELTFDKIISTELFDAQNKKLSIKNDTATLAAKAFFDATEMSCGAKIKIEKHIPFCGGMGGSSADAAGVIYALAMLTNKSLSGAEVATAAAKSGSDVAALIKGGFCVVCGRGDEAEKILCDRQLFFVVALGDGAETVNVFKAFDKLNVFGKNGKVENLLQALKSEQKINELVFNDLFDACCLAYPKQKDFVAKCTQIVGVPPTLTGSGSSVFWVFDDKDNAQIVLDKLAEKKQTAFVCASVPFGVCIL